MHMLVATLAALAAPATAPEVSSDTVEYTVPSRWPGGASVPPPAHAPPRTLSHKLSDTVSVRE
jgi:hypothetical protein